MATKIMAEQEKKIKKYEQRMRDLIEAYKTLSNEKEALESTVKALISNNSSSNQNDDESDNMNLNHQVVTLSNSIATLSEEKRKMERNYLEDKRVTRGEYETNISALKTELDSQQIVMRELKCQLNDVRSERNKCQETVLLDLKNLEMDRNSSRVELEDCRNKLLNKEAIILRLNEDCNYYRSVKNDLEQEMVVMKNGFEMRLALLEETITDLSRNIGQMEQQHLSDQEVIVKLTEKIKSNTIESRQIINQKESQSDTPDILQFQEIDKSSNNYNVDDIIEKMCQMRLQLLKLDCNVDAISLVFGDGWNNGHCNGDCVIKIKQLQEEIECSQQTIEGFMKMNCIQTSLSGSYQHQQEMDRLNQELTNTKNKMAKLQDDLSNSDISSTRNIKSLKDEMLKTEWNHKQQINKLQQGYNQTVLDLQSELTKHRNRTINLLSEKDLEIKNLQKIIQVNKPNSDHNSIDQIYSDDDRDHDHGLEHDSESSSSIRNINSCPLYQCCEMKARMDQELKSLRQQKRQFIMNLHKLESDIEYIKSDCKNEVDALLARAQRAESINKLSSGVNMEYLRNVLVRFLSTSDPSCRHLMAKAIGKVLQFSNEELSTLKKNNWK